MSRHPGEVPRDQPPPRWIGKIPPATRKRLLDTAEKIGDVSRKVRGSLIQEFSTDGAGLEMVRRGRRYLDSVRIPWTSEMPERIKIPVLKGVDTEGKEVTIKVDTAQWAMATNKDLRREPHEVTVDRQYFVHDLRTTQDNDLLERAKPQLPYAARRILENIYDRRQRRNIDPEQPVRRDELEALRKVAYIVSPEVAAVMGRFTAIEFKGPNSELTDWVVQGKKCIITITENTTIPEAVHAMVGVAYGLDWPRDKFDRPREVRVDWMSLHIRVNMALGKYGAPTLHNPQEELVYRPAFERGIIAARDLGDVQSDTPPRVLQRIGHAAAKKELYKHTVTTIDGDKVYMTRAAYAYYGEMRTVQDRGIESFHGRNDPRFVEWVDHVRVQFTEWSRTAALERKLPEGVRIEGVDVEFKWITSINGDGNETFEFAPRSVKMVEEGKKPKYEEVYHTMVAFKGTIDAYTSMVTSGGTITLRIMLNEAADSPNDMKLVDFYSRTGHFCVDSSTVVKGLDAAIAVGLVRREDLDPAKVRVHSTEDEMKPDGKGGKI